MVIGLTLEEILTLSEDPRSEDDAPGLATPFELWCEGSGIHPESSGAWAAYERSLNSTV